MHDGDVVPDAHPWRIAIILGLVAIAAGFVVSVVVPTLLGWAGWWIPGDAWMSLRAAHYVPQGTYPLIYETGTGRDFFDSGPLLPLVLAPIALIGDLFHLHESYPFPQKHPGIWFVYGPYALACAVPLLYAVRSLLTQLGVRAGRLFLQCAVLFLAFAPMAIVYGHYEDVLALALLLIALRDLFAERPLRGALFLATAIAFKQWSILAVPVFVAASPPAVRVRVAVRSVGPPVLLLSAFLVTDYRYASRALFHPSTFAGLGHAAPWISSSTDYIASAPTRLGTIGIAVLVGWLLRNRREPALVLSAIGCVFMARFFFEPVVHAYYLAPGIALLVLAERARGGRSVTKVIVGAALLLAFPLHPNRALWWIVAYALAGALLYGPVARLRRGLTVAAPADVMPTPSRPAGSGVGAHLQPARH